MGWKLSSIIINPKTDINYESLLNKLGFENLKKIENQYFDSAMYPDNDKVFLGVYKNNLIICADNLPLNFFDKNISDTEKKLIELFPKSEICAVSLQSNINHFGFAIIRNGEKIRAKAGDADLGTILDIGEPLEQEKELLSKSKIDKDGQRLYYFEDNIHEPYLENQVGENFVFEIFKRYTGESFDSDDELLDSVFEGFTFSKKAFSFDKYFSGNWQGQFIYGDSYRDLLRGEKQNFLISLTVENGQLQGTCIDDNKQSDNPATINGFIINNFICFEKKYTFEYVLDEKGQTQKDISKQSSNIAYSGLYDPLTDSFKGVWQIENNKFDGQWTMKRKND